MCTVNEFKITNQSLQYKYEALGCFNYHIKSFYIFKICIAQFFKHSTFKHVQVQYNVLKSFQLVLCILEKSPIYVQHIII